MVVTRRRQPYQASRGCQPITLALTGLCNTVMWVVMLFIVDPDVSWTLLPGQSSGRGAFLET